MRQDGVGIGAGEHERAPGDPQADAERRLVRAVAGDVADQGEEGAVVALDDVVEVATEQRLVPPGR